MKFTKFRINQLLPSKYYFTRHYTSSSTEWKENHQVIGGYVLKVKGDRLSTYDYAMGEAVPEWVYYGDYEFDAIDLITSWMDGQIGRSEVVASIQKGLQGDDDDLI